MKTKQFLLVAATVLSFAACSDENPVLENQIYSDKVETNFVPQPSDSTSVVFKAASTVYSSYVGYCTAGVRLDKGGYTKGNLVYGGVHWGGDAKAWYSNAKSAGCKVGSTPKVGAIVVWPSNTASSLGHVGVVTKCVNGVWYYKAMNDYPNGFNKWSERKITEYPNSKKPCSPTGYIYSW
jgi:surface antigen